MLTIDQFIQHLFNQFAGRNPAFDAFVVAISNNNLLKGGMLMMVFWAIWFQIDPRRASSTRHQQLLVVLGCSFVGECSSIFLQHLAPYRLRPLASALPTFQMPAGLAETAADWRAASSFPSDHATLFGGLAVAFCIVSWRVGLLALLYTLVVILLPRIYLGYHYPSDVFVGLLIGGTVILLGQYLYLRIARFRSIGDAWYARIMQHAGVLYGTLFLISFEIGELFIGSRALIQAFRHLFVAILRH